MNEADYEIKGELLGQEIKLFRLQPGDVLLAQPKNPLSQAASDSIHRQLSRMVEDRVHILVVPSTWKLAVAREVPDQEVVQGFAEMLKELG